MLLCFRVLATKEKTQYCLKKDTMHSQIVIIPLNCIRYTKIFFVFFKLNSITGIRGKLMSCTHRKHTYLRCLLSPGFSESLVSVIPVAGEAMQYRSIDFNKIHTYLSSRLYIALMQSLNIESTVIVCKIIIYLVL